MRSTFFPCSRILFVHVSALWLKSHKNQSNIFSYAAERKLNLNDLEYEGRCEISLTVIWRSLKYSASFSLFKVSTQSNLTKLPAIDVDRSNLLLMIFDISSNCNFSLSLFLIKTCLASLSSCKSLRCCWDI